MTQPFCEKCQRISQNLGPHNCPELRYCASTFVLRSCKDESNDRLRATLNKSLLKYSKYVHSLYALPFKHSVDKEYENSENFDPDQEKEWYFTVKNLRTKNDPAKNRQTLTIKISRIKHYFGEEWHVHDSIHNCKISLLSSESHHIVKYRIKEASHQGIVMTQQIEGQFKALEPTASSEIEPARYDFDDNVGNSILRVKLI